MRKMYVKPESVSYEISCGGFCNPTSGHGWNRDDYPGGKPGRPGHHRVNEDEPDVKLESLWDTTW